MKVFSMKLSIKNPNVTVSVVAEFQYRDNVLIAQKIAVTKTTTAYQSTTKSMNNSLKNLEIAK
jgi:hypothetical protein